MLLTSPSLITHSTKTSKTRLVSCQRPSEKFLVRFYLLLVDDSFRSLGVSSFFFWWPETKTFGVQISNWEFFHFLLRTFLPGRPDQSVPIFLVQKIFSKSEFWYKNDFHNRQRYFRILSIGSSKTRLQVREQFYKKKESSIFKLFFHKRKIGRLTIFRRSFPDFPINYFKTLGRIMRVSFVCVYKMYCFSLFSILFAFFAQASLYN